MIGSWRWNAGFGGFGAALTWIFSLTNNPIGTTFLRSLIAFLVFALLAFAVRFILGMLMLPSPQSHADERLPEERGSVLDLVTPDEGDALTEMMKEKWTESPAAAFQPLLPKRLVSLDQADPEKVVQAIRRLTDE
jgi:Na+/H+-dicarboxylate symporter